jgi:hypothetical protein
MFCTNCKQARVENETPCPHCGAPSPLLQLSGIGQWGTNNSAGAWSASSFGLSNNSQMNSWGGPVSYEASSLATEAQWGQGSMNQPMQQQSPSAGLGGSWGGPSPIPTTPGHNLQEAIGSEQQWGVPSIPNASWPQMSPAASNQSMSAWPDHGAERPAASQALLPVVYQEPQANDMRQSTVALQLIPQQAIEHLLPEIAAAPETVYVPPLFTKPRPITPRYRVISGSLSVLIVALLLCGGVGYYAQSSGMLGRVVRMFTNQAPASVQTPPTHRLPDPPDKIDTGEGAQVIPSGTTTLHIDNGNLPLETDKVFTVNQAFYVTYTVQPPQDGQVSVKWYMNGQLYHVATSNVKSGKTSYGSQQMQYLIPTEGSVEIYWNDQLAQRFYFVVQPS